MTSAANPDLVDRLKEQLARLADPERAKAMAAYMRNQFPFLGVPSPKLRLALRAAEPGRLGQPELTAVSRRLWQLPEREYQYAACFLLARFVKGCGPDFIDVAHDLIVAKPWWDTVDTLAAHTVGTLVHKHPGLVTTMDEWIGSDNIWLARTALLHQLRYKEATDVERLFRYALKKADHPDFFMRKAIGWALRQYAWVDPETVRAFVLAHEAKFSGLTKREALKNL
ncbi:MAG TPA: DNA alkylation repair protein [Candidatus Limnocylindrales bacterium]|nr:DNA alkylation repair protein [Candidatus Limnocylindrales bacterium]